jgi:hypothetical protein
VREIRTLGSVGAKLNGQATRPSPQCARGGIYGNAFPTLREMLQIFPFRERILAI